MRAKIICCALILSACNLVNAATTHCSETDKKGIEVSLSNYLNKGDISTYTFQEVTLLSENCVKGYAKVILHPNNAQTDDATVYLQQDKGNWQVLNFGTFFEPSFLAKLPKELR